MMGARLHRLRDCPRCGRKVREAAGLYRCDCGWSPADVGYMGMAFTPGPKYPAREPENTEPVDSFMQRRGAA